MNYDLKDITFILKTIEKEILDYLYDYDMLSKLDSQVKKVIIHFLFNKIFDIMTSKTYIIVPSKINIDLFLFEVFKKEDIEKTIISAAKKLSKATNKVIFTDYYDPYYTKIDGDIIDQINILESKTVDIRKELKKLIKKYNIQKSINEVSIKLF